MWVTWNLKYSFNLHFLYDCECWTLLQVFIGHLYFFWEFSVQFIYWFINCVTGCFVVYFFELLVYSVSSFLIRWIPAKIFVPFCKLSSHSNDSFFSCAVTFQFDEIPFVNPWSYFLSFLGSCYLCLYLPELSLCCCVVVSCFRSYSKVFDPLGGDFSIGQKARI
jgi:hypothetical protein